MPAVSMPSQENVNRALNAAQNTTAVSPVVAAAPINPSPAPAAPTQAPRPTTTPTSPVATPAAPAQSPAPTTPTSDPGAFRIPGM